MFYLETNLLKLNKPTFTNEFKIKDINGSIKANDLRSDNSMNFRKAKHVRAPSINIENVSIA